ncbi:MAG TPA: M23 family metallopeptidase [Candidatus Paceibacterota bacterium]|nr:M23 family metallopeptidase [Candidatus Paceibacterota bacterium]
MGEESISTIILLITFGGVGALVKEILIDGKLTLPKIESGQLFLGFLSSIIIGATVGYLVDHSPLMAFFAGYTGFSALGSLMPKNLLNTDTFEPATTTTKETEKTEEKISIDYPFIGTYGISQYFGENPEMYKSNGYAGHFGLDYLTPYGTEILACDSGEIIRSEFTTGNGNFCEIKHSWGTSLYCHFKNLPLVKVGDKVEKKQVIGHAGNTGAVRPLPTEEKPLSGTHLHFSIKLNSVSNPDFKNYIDPLPFLEKKV